MKFSYNWIRELVEDLDRAPGALEKLITMKTAECEGIAVVGSLLDRACAARVESVEPMAGGHNVKATVDAGRYGRKIVVCGAPNCRPGITTIYAPVGKKVVHGVESDGMLASAAELELNREHTGVLETEIQVGAPLPGCTSDSIIEIDNKSITHRPDLWGHLGMAREVAAILSRKLKDPVRIDLLPRHAGHVQIEVKDFSLCPRYSALVFENVTVKPSPLWLQYRLTSIGLNPINNIVDVTNYVMADLAQPMHAFDADRLRGGTIYVRLAGAGEPFSALNGEEYTLGPTNLVIADAEGAIALAGVIGGRDSAINESTRTIVLESANFHASSVRKTSAALKLRTDASMRFEKAQDPRNTVRAIARAIELLEQVSPGIRVAGGVSDAVGPLPPVSAIDLPLDWLQRKLGRPIDPGEVREILERLEFGISERLPGTFSVTVPTWRATKDIAIKDDLVEEVGRMVGYDSITPAAPLLPVRAPFPNSERKFQHETRNFFVDQGFTEVSNYSFLSEEAVRAFGFDPAAHVRVANPIAADQALMRASLLPGIWKNILENAKHYEAFRIFEIGLEVHKRDGGLPDEIPHLVAAVYSRDANSADVFELKRAAECLMASSEVRPVQARSFEHPVRSAEVLWEGEAVGRLFELHPSLIELGRASVLDLDLKAVQRLATVERKYTPIRRYPSSAFDLSVIAGLREEAGQLRSVIASFGGPLVESIQFLRQFTGAQFEGKKSVSFRITVSSQERTLSSEEIAEIRDRMIEGLRKTGYELRV
jgi:phenylalanyl-tRNA synthetase beta chain